MQFALSDITPALAIGGLTVLIWLIYEANVWHRRRRAAMTPEERRANDDDPLNMW